MDPVELDRFLQWLNALIGARAPAASKLEISEILGREGQSLALRADQKKALPGRLLYDLDDAKRIAREIESEARQRISAAGQAIPETVEGIRISATGQAFPEGIEGIPDSDPFVLINFILNDVLEADGRFSPQGFADLPEPWMATARAFVGEFNDFLVAFPARALRGQQYTDAVNGLREFAIVDEARQVKEGRKPVSLLTAAQQDALLNPQSVSGADHERAMQRMDTILADLPRIREQGALVADAGGPDVAFRNAVVSILTSQGFDAFAEGRALLPSWSTPTELRAQRLDVSQREVFGTDPKTGNLVDLKEAVENLARSQEPKITRVDDKQIVPLKGDAADSARSNNLALDEIIRVVTARGNELVGANVSEPEIQTELAALTDQLLADSFGTLKENYELQFRSERAGEHQKGLQGNITQAQNAAKLILADSGHTLEDFRKQDQTAIINIVRASEQQAKQELTPEVLEQLVGLKKIEDEQAGPKTAVNRWLAAQGVDPKTLDEQDYRNLIKKTQAVGLNSALAQLVFGAQTPEPFPGISPLLSEMDNLSLGGRVVGTAGEAGLAGLLARGETAREQAAAETEADRQRRREEESAGEVLEEFLNREGDGTSIGDYRNEDVDAWINTIATQGVEGLRHLPQFLPDYRRAKQNEGIVGPGARGGPAGGIGGEVFDKLGISTPFNAPFQQHLEKVIGPQLRPYLEAARRADPFTDLTKVAGTVLGLPGFREPEKPSVFTQQDDPPPAFGDPYEPVFPVEDPVSKAFRLEGEAIPKPFPSFGPNRLSNEERLREQLDPTRLPTPRTQFPETIAALDEEGAAQGLLPFPKAPPLFGVPLAKEPLEVVFPDQPGRGRGPQAIFPDTPGLMSFLQQQSGGDVDFQRYLINLFKGSGGKPSEVVGSFTSFVEERERERKSAFNERVDKLWESGFLADVNKRREFISQFDKPFKGEFLPFFKKRASSFRSQFEATPQFAARQQSEAARKESEATQRRSRLLRRGRTTIRRFGRA